MLWMLQLKWQLTESHFQETSSMSDIMLKNHVKQTYNFTAGLGDCFLKCSSHEFCLSFNFHQLTSVCELNDATHKYFADDLHNVSSVIYMVYSLRTEARKLKSILIFFSKVLQLLS